MQPKSNLIVNGDFEASNTSVSPWKLTPSLFNIVPITLTPTLFTFDSGKNALDLNFDYYPVSINQNVTTTVGTTYLLTFVISASNNDPTFSASVSTKSGIMYATGAQVQSFSITADATTGKFGYVTVQYYFVANQANTMITIGSTTPQNYGPIIDNVKLSPVVRLTFHLYYYYYYCCCCYGSYLF